MNYRQRTFNRSEEVLALKFLSPCSICSHAWATLPTERDKQNRPRAIADDEPEAPGYEIVPRNRQ